MKLMVPNKNITHVCLDGVHYPVLDGVLEVPEGLLAQELERLGYEPVADLPPPPGLVFEAEADVGGNLGFAQDIAPPLQEITKIQKTENKKQRTRK